MTWSGLLLTAAATIAVGWGLIAIPVLLEDRAARRRWQLEDERYRWQQTIDAMRRMYEDDADLRGDA